MATSIVSFDDARPWVEVPTDLDGVLDEWSDLLVECWSAWRAIGRQMESEPLADSPVGLEDAALDSIRPGWGPHEAGQCAYQAAHLVDGAAQHLLGLKALVDGRQLILPPWPVVRAEIEHLARATWILDPEIDSEARVARCWMERLYGAHRRRWALGASRAPRAEERRARQHREQTRAEIHKRFEGALLPAWTDPEEQPRWSVAGEEYPSIGQACRRFGEIGGLRGAHGLYDILAASSHPNALELSLIAAPIEVDGRIEFPFRVGAEIVVGLLGTAAVVMYRGAWLICSYVGLDGVPLEQWADRVTAIAPTLLTDSGDDGAQS